MSRLQLRTEWQKWNEYSCILYVPTFVQYIFLMENEIPLSTFLKPVHHQGAGGILLEMFCTQVLIIVFVLNESWQKLLFVF